MSPGVLPGGFLGVDVFFVISGALITAIIDRDVTAGRFRLGGFYGRRVRRIAPALLAMLGIVGVAATIILLPSDLIGFAKSALATLGSVSNVYFWRVTDYFSRAALTKPLLHTWSLGIEEQFYLFFPLLILALARVSRRWLLPALIGLALVSLAANIYGARFSNGMPAFFLLPTRIWELAAGGILAVLPAGSSSPRRLGQEMAAFAGVVLVALGFAGTGPLPGALPTALPAVLGAMLLIGSAGRAPTLVARGLGSAPLVGLGLISYSLYLWHWPVLSLSRYVLVRELLPAELIAALAAMLALAILSWAYVERPFRRPDMPIGRVIRLTGAAATVLGLAALGLIAANGFPGRLDPAVARYNALVGTHFSCDLKREIWFGDDRACGLALPSRRPADAQLVLLGNSHAAMYAPLVTRVLVRRGAKGLLVAANGCLPMTSRNLSPACAAIAERNIAAVAAVPGRQVVVIAFDWPLNAVLVGGDRGLSRPGGVAGLLDGLAETVDRLQRAGKTVVLVGPIATPGWDMPSDLSRKLGFGRPVNEPMFADAVAFRARHAPVYAWAKARKLPIIRVSDVECGPLRCDFIRAGQLLFADESHVAGTALPLFDAIFDPVIADALASLKTEQQPATNSNAAFSRPASPSNPPAGRAPRAG